MEDEKIPVGNIVDLLRRADQWNNESYLNSGIPTHNQIEAANVIAFLNKFQNGYKK